MIKAETAEKEIIKFIDRWQHNLALDTWRIYLNLQFHRYDENDEEVTCSVKCNYVYKYVTLTAYKHYLETDKWGREKAIVHELIHCVLAQTQLSFKEYHSEKIFMNYPQINTMQETETEQLARAFMLVRHT